MKLDANETGGWITPAGQIAYVEFEEHLKWILSHIEVDPLHAYESAFDQGYVRFANNSNLVYSEIALQGNLAALKASYPIWFPALREVNDLIVEIADSVSQGLRRVNNFDLPGDTGEVRKIFGPDADLEELRRRSGITASSGQ